MNSPNRLDHYLDAFRRRLRKLTLLQGIATTAVVLLVMSVIGAWFSTESGFSADTVAAFRIFLILAVAAVIITRVIQPLRDIETDISRKVEARTPDFGGRIETYVQMKESNNPFRDLLAENTMTVSDEHPVEKEISPRDFSIAGAVGGTAVVVLLVLLVAGPGMMNYSLRNLFAGWAFDDLLPPQTIVVTPGDQSVRRGANLQILAEMDGFSPDEAIIHVRETGGDWQDVSMVKSPAGFEFTFFSLQQNMAYYVSTTGMRSPQYEVQVVDVPGIESLELTYHYPQWTERDPETFDTGDIRTLPDTRIELKITTTSPLPAGQLILNDNGQPLVISGVDATTDFTVLDEGDYFIAAIVGGEQVRLSDDYFIRIAEDGKPVIEFIKPGGDWNASNIEEVTARIEASDDFNLESLSLKYSVNGGDWETVALAENTRDITAEHIFMLEDIRVPEELVTTANVGEFTIITSEDALEQATEEAAEDYLDLIDGRDDIQPPTLPGGVPLVPGDLISFYAEGNDRTQTVRTDMFFIQIQGFTRRYSQSQMSGGGGGGGGGGPQDEISNRQRQIITSTWNLIREQAENGEEGQVRVNSSLLSELQTTLAEQAATLAQRTRARQLANQDEQIELFVTNMEQAVQSMYPASERLALVELDEAIGPAQEALQHLLRAEAVFNEFQVQNQQQGGGGGGGGGRAQQDLAEMFELEMDLELNQYETGSNASPQAQQAEEEDIMSQLDELAKRQQQLANNLRNQQQLTEAQRYQQEMLRRQTEELQDRLEQLQQQRESLQRGQQGQQTAQNEQQGQEGQQQGQQGQQGQPGQPGASGQQGQPGQPGQSGAEGGQQGEQPGEQIAQSELQRRLESAIRAMEQSAEAMRGNASPEELQRAADEAGRQLEGARDQIAADQLADMQSSFSNMADQAERMVREQQRQEQVLQAAMQKAVEDRESGEDPNSRGMELQEEWELAREKTALAAELSSLQEQMLSAMQRFGDDVPDASRELQRANQDIVDNELEQALSNAALYIDAGYGLYIAGNESAVTAEMRNLADRLEEAQEMVVTQGAPGNSDLDVARRQAQALRAQLQEQLAQNGQPGQGQQQGQQQDQQGQGQGQGQQGQQSQNGGQQQGGNNAGGGGRFAGNRFGPWNGNDPLNNGPIDISDEFYGNLDQFTDIARDAVQDLELNAEELAQMNDWIRQLEATRLNRNEDILAQEYNDMLALIEQLEVGLQLDTQANNPNNVRTATPDAVPDEYKESVAEYYRRLSRE